MYGGLRGFAIPRVSPKLGILGLQMRLWVCGMYVSVHSDMEERWEVLGLGVSLGVWGFFIFMSLGFRVDFFVDRTCGVWDFSGMWRYWRLGFGGNANVRWAEGDVFYVVFEGEVEL